MTKAELINQCLLDAISALDIPNLPNNIEIGNEYIYPAIAIRRIKSAMRSIAELNAMETSSR